MGAEAHIGWGVALVDPAYGEVHESVEGANLYGIAQRFPSLKYVDAGFPDNDVLRPVIFIRRSWDCTEWSVMNVDPATLDQPTAEEAAALWKFLDEAGFTGARLIELLLTPRYED